MKINYLLLLLGFCLFSCTSSHNAKHQQLNQQADTSIPEITEVMVENKNPKVSESTKKNVSIKRPNPLDSIPVECILDLAFGDVCKFNDGSTFGPPDKRKQPVEN